MKIHPLQNFNIYVVSQKSVHGWSTLQECWNRGWVLFQVFLHLTTKECLCHMHIVETWVPLSHKFIRSMEMKIHAQTCMQLIRLLYIPSPSCIVLFALHSHSIVVHQFCVVLHLLCLWCKSCVIVMCYRYWVNPGQCAVYQQQCCEHHEYWNW